MFPWVEKIDTDAIVQPSLFESAAAAEADYENDPEYQRMRDLVLAEVPISTNEGFDYKHLYFIALHDFQVASF